MAALDDVKFLVWHETNTALRSMGQKELEYKAMFPTTDYETALQELNQEYPGLRYA